MPDKNIRMLQGKPLIGWAIEQARAAKSVERVIVSTDSGKISDIAREFGAEVPFVRPEYLARDDSPEWAAWQHALQFLKDTEGRLPDCMLSVPTTSPLRLPQDLDLCVNEFSKGHADVVVTIAEPHRNPYFNMVSIAPSGEAKLVISPDNDVSRRQDAKAVYDLTTVAYAVKPAFVMSKSSLFQGVVYPVQIPLERAMDIDTELDFEIANFLMGKRLASA